MQHKRKSPDFAISYSGGLTMLFPLSEEAQEWCNTKLSPETTKYSGGVVIEKRYVEQILEALEQADLEVEAA